MAILLTNGKYYISHNKTGAVIKVSDIEQAQNFYSVERAIRQKNKTPTKCAGYYFIDTDISQAVKKAKRKKLLERKRLLIYRKTKGHCYLCGDFVDYNAFEIEHKVPISKGGTNDLSNLYCSCHYCNSMKQDIYFENFMKKLSQIFIYQMYNKNRGNLKWKIMHSALKKMM